MQKSNVLSRICMYIQHQFHTKRTDALLCSCLLPYPITHLLCTLMLRTHRHTAQSSHFRYNFFSSSLCIYLILAYRRCYGQTLERFLCTQIHPLIYSERGRERENGNKRTHLSNIVAIAIIKHRRRHCKRHRRRRLFYLVSLIGGVI